MGDRIPDAAVISVIGAARVSTLVIMALSLLAHNVNGLLMPTPPVHHAPAIVQQQPAVSYSGLLSGVGNSLASLVFPGAAGVSGDRDPAIRRQGSRPAEPRPVRTSSGRALSLPSRPGARAQCFATRC